MTTPTQDAYAVCRYDLDGWIPLSSIADNPELSDSPVWLPSRNARAWLWLHALAGAPRFLAGRDLFGIAHGFCLLCNSLARGDVERASRKGAFGSYPVVSNTVGVFGSAG